MSFHEMGAPPRRKNQEPTTDAPLTQRHDRTDSPDMLSPSAGAAGYDLSGIDTHGPAPTTAPSVQRQPLDTVPAVVAAEPGTAAPTRPASLIVDDAVMELRPGQLRKTEFLDQLRPAVHTEAELALAGTGRSTADCPYLDHWFNYYRGQRGEHVENAIRRYAPETRDARTAAEYVPLVAARVREGVTRWASTGDLSGVPEDMPPGMTGGIGGLLFAEREGGARADDDPTAVQARLGAGRPLDSGVRSRMESAFGRSFVQVRAHTDTTGSRLSAEQNAKAFTVGEHIAFGTGEYRPGTIVGDVLIAHELAHVTQQSGASTGIHANHGALEQDADRSAVGAVAALWAGSSRTPSSRAGSGLRLQRCGGTQGSTRTPSAVGGLTRPPVPAPPASAPTGRGLDARAQAVIDTAQNASVPIADRAKAVVLQIISQYFPADAPKVKDIQYDESIPGLRTDSTIVGTNVPRTLFVGKYFVENTTKRTIARRVLQVKHELQHVDQLRAGMGDKDEREFLAHHQGALAAEIAGTGRMQHATRVNLIDSALGYYNCLSAEKQARYQSQRDELLARRSVEVRASGTTQPAPPSTCRRPPS
jgi:hypothetical protein